MIKSRNVDTRAELDFLQRILVIMAPYSHSVSNGFVTTKYHPTVTVS